MHFRTFESKICTDCIAIIIIVLFLCYAICSTLEIMHKFINNNDIIGQNVGQIWKTSGTKSVTTGTIVPVVNMLKYALFQGPLVMDLTRDHRFEALAICESLVVDDDPECIKAGSVPQGYTICHVPRPSACDREGGGVCVSSAGRTSKLKSIRYRIRSMPIVCLIVYLLTPPSLDD